MPDPLYNDMHIKSVLVMLPYDADKVAGYGLKLEVNGKTADQLQLGKADTDTIHKDFPVGSTVSFLDADKKRVYFKLIADSDDKVGKGGYSAGHDAAAFIEVDKNGHELTTAQGKPHIIVTFPGANDLMHGDLADAITDRIGATSYSEPFMNGFIAKLAPQLIERGVSFHDTQTVAHSMGDKFALEYAARFEAKSLVIDGWDKQDSAVGAAVRNVLREHLGHSMADAAFGNAVIDKMKRINAVVTEVNADGGHAVVGEHAYDVKNTGHLAKNFMNRAQTDLIEIKAANAENLARAAVAAPGFWSGTNLAEDIFIASMQNGYDALQATYDAQSKKDTKLGKQLNEYERAMLDAKAKFADHNISYSAVMETAAAQFLTPNATPAKTPEKGPVTPQR